MNEYNINHHESIFGDHYDVIVLHPPTLICLDYDFELAP